MKRIGLFLIFCILNVLSCSPQGVENNIILINIEHKNRHEIAETITKICLLSPKLLAIDLDFQDASEYDQDTQLIFALLECKNLVMATIIDDYIEDKPEYKGFVNGWNPYLLVNAKTGFTNAILENDNLKTLSRFSISEKVGGRLEYNFAIRVAMDVNSSKTIDFIKTNPNIVEIDYKNGERVLKKILATQVLNNQITREDFEGKIVMIGFLGPGDDDKHFTPLNKKIKPYKPDMYGLEILANIVAQVLEYQND
jgi:CHASE2 domain-containing sensor protein